MAKSEESSKVSKVQMCEDAFKSLGLKAKPDVYLNFIKEKYGTEMTKGHVSQYKSTFKKKMGLGKHKKSVSKADFSRAASHTAAPSPKASAASKTSLDDVMELMSLLKTWDARIGSDKIRSVLELIAAK